MPSTPEERTIVIALFKEKSSLQKAIVNEQLIATNLEIAADEAILVAKNEDATLTINRSKHSVGRSLVVLSTKLMVVVPLGFTGALALGVAGLELSGAARKRETPTDVDEVDLSFLVEQMQVGWTAVLAAYSPKLLESAIDSFTKLGAVMIWHAPESKIEDVVAKNQIEI